MIEVSYAVLIPCKDGEKTIEQTLMSVFSQTIPPKRIIVVDDASHDQTPIILQRFPNIVVVRLEHNYPKNFARVPKLINIAARYVPRNYKYVMILGDDTVLQKDYAERILLKFKQNPRLKIASGGIRESRYVRGVARLPQGSGRLFDFGFLKKHLPFPENIGWESWILFKGMMEGEVARFTDVTFDHQRHYGTYSIRTFGHSMYVLGYPFVFVVGRTAKDFLIKAYDSRFQSLYLLLGYVEFYLTNQRQLADVKKFVRQTQMIRLLNFLKRRLIKT